jgi:hypothetical protein
MMSYSSSTRTIYLLLVAAVIGITSAFQFAPAMGRAAYSASALRSTSNGYIPDGLSPQQWEVIKAKEQSSKKGNLGKLGVTSFESRSMVGWMLDGQRHNFAKDPKKVSKENLPYMQKKGGSWKDNAIQVTDYDVEYENGGEKKWQSASFWFGGSGNPTETLFGSTK